MKRIVVFYFLIFIIITTSYAQNPQWQTYNSANSGLPGGFVLQLAIDGSGNKWIGTGYAGLAKFDGTNWTVYNPSNSGLPDTWITALDVDFNNNVWIGTATGGLVFFDGMNWTIITEYPISSSICIASQNIKAIWFGTYGGLALSDGTDLTVWDESNSDIPSNTVYAIAFEPGIIKWIGTNNGLASFDGTNWVVYDESNSPLPHNNVFAIAIDSLGVKWIGTQNGLVSIENGVWNIYTSSNSGLPADHISGIYVDGENNKWIATFGNTGGLAKFDGTNWTIYNSSNTTLDNYLRSIAGENNGNVWVGSNGYGLSVVNENGLTSLEQINESIVNDYSLDQNYPNPFNPTTNIKYSIPKSSMVSLKIYDILGSEVMRLVNEEKSIGNYEVEFNAVNIPSGVYIYKLKAGSFVESKKMILLK